ncbi:glycosyltransferase family 4 protein [Rhodococcoides corynebacterioides]|uniref:glycosyltransferase family 4 protein n=1 Tax=Rhodococcoides corynebacterioides TaxID=53972 RepID=UPI0027E0DFF5|nr:glycosyltransferase family 4 protein [Rhodococcus corynebacterioides]
MLSESMRDYFTSASSENLNFRVKYNCLEDEPRPLPVQQRNGLVCIGRLEREKGFDLAIAGWCALTQKPRLHIVGDGELAPLAQQVQREHPELVTWHPQLPHHDTLNLLASSSLSINLPRWQEPFGRVALESIALGVPVVHSGRGALSEVVGPGGWAAALHRGDVADVLQRALIDAEWKSADAREHYLANFSADATTRQLHKIYVEAISDADSLRMDAR